MRKKKPPPQRMVPLMKQIWNRQGQQLLAELLLQYGKPWAVEWAVELLRDEDRCWDTPHGTA